MPAPVAAVPSEAPQGQAKKGTAANIARIPFARSSKLHIEQASVPGGSALAINAGQPGLLTVPLPTFGYLSAVFITVSATGGTGTAATYYEDAPWSAIASITLQDVNGAPLLQLSGYHAYLAAKFGGYRLFGPDISALTSLYNGGTSAGNFNFILPIYLEFAKDGLGSMPNMDSSARYQLQIQLASGVAGATGPLYTVAPTGYPTVSVQVEVLCRSMPTATDSQGTPNTIAPPAVGTAQYWTYQTFPSLSGAQTPQLARVGNLIRNHILVFRDSANGTRATAEASDLPPNLEMDWDNFQRYIANVATLRQQLLSQTNGYDAPKGVIVLPNTLDPDWTQVAENCDQYLPTMGATKLAFKFTPAASVGLTVLTNDVVAASSAIYQAALLSAS